MLRKSFLNPFSSLLVGLAFLAFLVDVVLRKEGDVDAFAPSVLFAMWLVGGLVRLYYEKGAERAFLDHTAEAHHALVWKKCGDGWVQISSDSLACGDVVRVSAGMLCPVDASLLEGRILLSDSLVTGEGGLSERGPGRAVLAGSSVVDGWAIAKVVSKPAEAVRLRFGNARRTERRVGAKDVCFVFVRCMLVVVPFAFFARGVVMGDWGQAMLFALGTAVGLVPEMLPVVNGVCLSNGARRLKAKGVIVKDVEAMEALGSMDVVCVDKTGTLTEDIAVLEYYTDASGNESLKTLQLGYLECSKQRAASGQLNAAVIAACEHPSFRFPARDLSRTFSLLANLPFDHVAKMSGVKLSALSDGLGLFGLDGLFEEGLTVVKGEVESVCARCSWVERDGVPVPMDEDGLACVLGIAEEMRSDGVKVLAVAYGADTASWEGLVLCGFLGFFDAPKKSAREAVDALSGLSVEVRVMTGDSFSVAKSVCSRLGILSDDLVTGAMLAGMTESEALVRIARTRVFAEVTPAQKAMIVRMTKLAGYSVGYVGDGMNDVPALLAADVGIVVDSAAFEPKEAADLVLLERDLAVVAEGVVEGRKAFANASKYTRIAASSNFGNVCSVAAASAFLPFLPATAAQLLVLNLSYDAVCMAIPWDDVDDCETAKARTWSGKGLGGFMLLFGLVSAVFDIVTFAILFFIVCPAACGGCYFSLDSAGQGSFVSMFQSGWLLECAWTQSLAILALRTAGIGDRRSRACRPLVAMVALMVVASSLILFGPAASLFTLGSLPLWYLGVVALTSVLYVASVVAFKRVYLSRTGSLL